MADVDMEASAAKEEPMEQQNGEDQALIEDAVYKQCIAKKVAADLAKDVVALTQSLGLTSEEFDERTIEQLASFPVDQGRYLIKEIKNSHLYGVQNKPQYLMSLMRNLKDRIRQLGPQQALTLPLVPGPDIEKISEIVNRNGYQLEVTVGQRKYHAPESAGLSDPTHGHEVYIGNIPRELFEDSLIPLFESIGTIFDMRLMLDPIYGKNRGYAFLLYTDKDHATEAAKKFDGHEIEAGKPLKVNVSVANKRLFIGSIPKSKSREEILSDLQQIKVKFLKLIVFQIKLGEVVDVIIYSSPDMPENRKNRGFCFVDFVDHKTASDAKRRLQSGKIRPWNGDLVVDWAEQQDEPDEETMSTVKVLYVKNLKESVTEEKLQEMFAPYGEIEKVKKLRDYAFIHYKERDAALKAMEALKGTVIDDIEVDISLAKPQSENKSKKKVVTTKRGMGMPVPNRGFAPRGARGSGFGGGPGFGKPFGAYDSGYGAYGYQSGPPGAYYDPYAGYQDPYAQGGFGGAGAYGYGSPGGFRGGFRGNARGGNPRGAGKRRGDFSAGGPTPKRGGRPI